MLSMHKQAGVSLVELMIAIVIVSLLMAMGAPSFNLWIQSTQVRTAAESIQNGLQIARTEAVRRNTNVRFRLTDAGGMVAWSVDCVTVTADCPAGIQVRSGGEGGSNARAGVAVATGTLGTALAAGAELPAGVTFDGLGRVPTANVGTDIARIDVTNAVRADARRMVILVSPGGQTRMCDPELDLATNPQGCA
jgi:type IV fimbrial biogenesis protein FimT